MSSLFGRADRDPQDHRPHLKIVDARERADHGEDPRQRDEHRLALRRARRRQLGPDEVEASGHRSGKQSFDVQFHHANCVKATIVANFLPARVTSASWLLARLVADRLGPALPPYCGMDPKGAVRC